MINVEKIWNSPSLPSLPTVAVELLNLSRDAEAPISAFSDVIITDPAMCGKILKATNSSYFGFTSKIVSIEKAVSLLGRSVVTSLALSFSLSDDCVPGSELSEYFKEYWLHSAVQAAACESFGRLANTGNDSDYFVAGLMTDVGRLAFLNTISREYFPVLVAGKEQVRSLIDVETEKLGVDHAKVSAKLIENWNLPESICEGIADQHATAQSLIEKYGEGEFDMHRAIATASAVGDYICTQQKGKALQQLKELTDVFYGFTMSDLQKHLVALNKRVQVIGELLSINTEELPDPRELMTQANQQLVEFTMQVSHESMQLAASTVAMEKEKEELRTQNDTLQEKIGKDSLTGIYNRDYFNNSILEEVEDARSKGNLLGLIFLDIDHFKNLNDTYGHMFGDQVLQGVAKSLESCVRKTDTVCRYGGEEFVIIVSNPSDTGIQKLAERVRARIASEEFELGGGESVCVTMSLGVSLVLPGRKEENVHLRMIKEADEAMYESKENGRDQIHFRSLLSDEQHLVYRKTHKYRFSRWLVREEIVSVRHASQALLQTQTDHRKIGQIVLDAGFLNDKEVQQITQLQEQRPERFGELALKLGWLDMDQLAYVLALQIEDPTCFANTLVQLDCMTKMDANRLVKRYISLHNKLSKSVQIPG